MSQERQKDRPEEYVVCPCFNVKRGQIMRCLESGSARDLDEIRILSHAGAGCAGCEFEVEELVEEFYRERGPTGLSTRQKALRNLLILNKRLIERNVELLRNVRSTFSPRPSFFGTWWVERADLHTRINLCNIASPAAPQRLWTERITIEVFSETGALLSANDRTLRQSETFSCEVRDLLPDSCLGGHGLLRVKYHNRRALGSKRFYSHYHNAKGLTLVHEKFSGYRKGPGGYWTLSGLSSSETLETSLIVSNGTAAALNGCVILTNAKGEERRAPLETLAPFATRLVNLPKTFPDMPSFLTNRAGTAHLSLRNGVMTCYIVHNRETGAWQIQHL